MKKMIKPLLGLALLAGFMSCDNEEIIAEGDGDAFIVTKVVGDAPVHGLALHAMGNLPFSSVMAVDDDGTSFSLKSYSGYEYEFYFETDDDDYSDELPVVGTYEFTMNLQRGETLVSTDELTDDIIDPATLTKCEYNATGSRIEVTWEEMDNADYFVVLMKDANNATVFISAALTGSSTGFNISSSTASWASGQTAEEGETYTVEVHAFMYEPTGTSLNLQAKSIATATAVWGAN
ncbi:MAG: hypothetical protein AB7U05_12870 [Mangrovibacterium sp.]